MMSILFFLLAFVTLVFNFKSIFIILVIFEMFSLSVILIFLTSKNQLFIFGLFLFVLSAIFCLIFFFCFLMFYNNNKSLILF